MRRVRIFAGLDFRERLHGCTQLVGVFTARKATTHKPFSTPISSGQSPEPHRSTSIFTKGTRDTHHEGYLVWLRHMRWEARLTRAWRPPSRWRP